MKQLIRILLGIAGAIAGYGVVRLLEYFHVLMALSTKLMILIYILASAAGFIALFLASKKIVSKMETSMDRFSDRISNQSMKDIAVGTLGLVIGLIIALIVTRPLLQLNISNVGNTIGVILSVIIYIVFGVLGIRVATKKKDDIIRVGLRMTQGGKQGKSDEDKPSRNRKKAKAIAEVEAEEVDPDREPLEVGKRVPKILDTSVIIDGRIFEVMKLGFLEGPFVVSQYVLEELQHISDSEDSLRRERGRRGLDHLGELQRQAGSQLIIDKQKLNQAKEVDAKLLVLTEAYQGAIVTNDYNLNKVASVQGITVLNVNDLANALKPVVIPGDRMQIEIIKAGKAAGQGLGYLEDGTMVVVENGYAYIGQTVDVVVTSQLQTSAGKMIFVKIPD